MASVSRPKKVSVELPTQLIEQFYRLYPPHYRKLMILGMVLTAIEDAGEIPWTPSQTIPAAQLSLPLSSGGQAETIHAE